jgi:hypothetical protein
VTTGYYLMTATEAAVFQKTHNFVTSNEIAFAPTSSNLYNYE